MSQKWYNRILWASGLICVIGTLIGMPFLELFDLDIILWSYIVLIVPVSGIIFLMFIVWGDFTRRNYFGHWVKSLRRTA